LLTVATRVWLQARAEPVGRELGRGRILPHHSRSQHVRHRPVRSSVVITLTFFFIISLSVCDE
jgi:hypothetical protein